MTLTTALQPKGSSPRLYRVNIMLADEDSSWLDKFADEIQEASGGQGISIRNRARSNRRLTRATSADGSRHRGLVSSADDLSQWFGDYHACNSGCTSGNE